MTTNLIELSKQAAEVLGVMPFKAKRNNGGELFQVWLAEDSGRCAEIANSRMLNTRHYLDAVMIDYVDEDLEVHWHAVYLSAYQGDRNAAWRVAVLKAVIDQGKL